MKDSRKTICFHDLKRPVNWSSWWHFSKSSTRRVAAWRQSSCNWLHRCTQGISQAKELADTLHMFIRMYRPHAAREDTILFPLADDSVGKEFHDLGEELKKKKRSSSGKGFEKIVAQVPSWKKAWIIRIGSVYSTQMKNWVNMRTKEFVWLALFVLAVLLTIVSNTFRIFQYVTWPDRFRYPTRIQ